MEKITDYEQIYPLECFPLLKEFRDNLHLYSKDKNQYYELFINAHLNHGLKVICRITGIWDDDITVSYDAYVSMVGGPERDLFYLGDSYASKEELIQKLEEYSDSFFSLEEWDKERIQKFFIDNLKEGDFE